ncbi:MAG TPA: PAS domain-containing protein, partial [Nannocystaceae bacterium]|nr:PAS domain-containing protein [Nannocystaceae bacterium]
MVVVSVLLALCAASPVESGAFALLVATAIGGLVCVIVLIGAVRELAAEVRRAREDAARLRALVGGFGDMVLTFHLDADGRFTDVSPSARALLGIAPGDLIGQRYADTLHADAVEDATGPVREATFVHPDGGTRTLMLATRLDTWTGATEGIAFDVTSTKAAMVALRRSDERFRSAFEEAGVGLGELDLLGRWTRLNPRLAEILRADTAESRSLHDLTHPDDHAPL